MEFSFDVFDVTLDFDVGTATVSDVLSTDDSDTTSLAEFLEPAASLGDDPAIGDGLTEMQRRPPTYEVGSHGEVEPLAGERP